MNNETILKVEEALRHHSDYKGYFKGSRYLTLMDALAFNYKGSLSQKVSGLLADYYKAVGVQNLKEAISRLKEIDAE